MCVRKPIDLLDEIERTIQGTFREMKLPEDQKKLRQDENAKRLREFNESFESGSMADLRHRFDERIDTLTKDLVKHLQSADSIKSATNVESSSDESEIAGLVNGRLSRAICNFRGVQKVSCLAGTDLGPEVEEEVQRLIEFRSEIVTVMPSLSPTEDDAIAPPVQNPENNLKKVAKYVAIVLASPLLLVLSPVYMAVKYVKKSMFRQSFKSAYEAKLKEICSEPPHELRDYVKNAVIATSPTATIVYKYFKELLKATEQDLAAARDRQVKDYEKKYEQLLKKCQKQIGQASLYVLHLGIHNYTRDDFVWPDPPTTAGGGSFGIVHKVKLKGKDSEDVALKVFKRVIAENNAQIFLREFAAVRLVQNPSIHIIVLFQVCF